MQLRSLKTNAIYSAVTNFSDVLLFGLMVVAARILGAEGFGTFSFSISIATIFLTLANLGLNTLAVRDVARNKDIAAQYLSNIMSWKVLLSIIAFGFLILTVFFFMESSKEIQILVSLLGLAVMLRFFTMTARAFLQAFERFDVETIAVLVEQGVLLIAGVVLLFLGYGVIGLAVAFLCGRFVGVVVILALLKKIVKFSCQFDRRFSLGLQMRALPIGIGLLVATAYLHVDTLILSWMQTYSQVGLYNAAFKIYVGLFLLPSIVCSVLLPRLSSSYAEKQKQNDLLVRGSLSLVAVSLPIGLGGILFGGDFIRFLFGEGFGEATTTLQILCCVTTLTFQIWLLRVFLISINKQNILLVLNVFGLFARIVFDLMFIPHYGIIGAAIATGVSEFLLFCGIWLYLIKTGFDFRGISHVIGQLLVGKVFEPRRVGQSTNLK